MLKVIFSLMASAMVLAATAQEEPVIIEKIIVDTVPNTGKKMDQQKVVTIRFKGDKAKEEKYTIVIDGSKIKVNGKDVADMKDIDINIGENRIMWNDRKGGVVMLPKQRMMEAESRLRALKDRAEGKALLQGNKALLGIGMEKVADGVEITSVTKESGAEKAGLQKGDIITKIEDKEIKAEMDITKIVGENKPGKEITINYLRDGKKKTTNATLGKNNQANVFEWEGMDGMKGMEGFKFQMPEMPEMPGMPGMPGMKEFDFRFEGDMPQFKMFKDGNWQDGAEGGMIRMHQGPKLGLSLKETESGNGLEVTNVQENSVAAKAGLQKGDILTKAAGTEVKDIKDIKEIVEKNKDKTFELNYLRNGKAGNVEIKFPKKLKEASL